MIMTFNATIAITTAGDYTQIVAIDIVTTDNSSFTSERITLQLMRILLLLIAKNTSLFSV